MDTKDSNPPSDTKGRAIPVEPETLEAIKNLQDQFVEQTGGKISQLVVVQKAVAKLTIADILPHLESQTTH